MVTQDNIQMQPTITQTLPPGLNQPIQGHLSIILTSISFMSKVISSNINYRIKFWGQSQKDYCVFYPSDKGLSVQYNACSSKDVLSQYLFDTQTLVIQLVDTRNGKGMGMIPIPIKRFSTLDNNGRVRIDGFIDRFDIYDLRKSKIGEATVGLGMDYNTVKIEPVARVGPARFERISQMSEPYTNRTENQIVKLMQIKPQTNVNPPEQVHPFQHPVYGPLNIPNPYHQNNHLPPLPTKKRKPQLALPQTQKLNIVKTNVQLQTLKLRNDQHLLHKEEQSTFERSMRDSEVQYTIEILNVKLKSKVAKPLEKLTIVYPVDGSASNHMTTIINPLTVQNNTYYFGHELLVRLGKMSQEAFNSLSVSVYFGQGFAQMSFRKLAEISHQQMMILRKKDNNKHSELTLRITPKLKKEEYKLYISLGRYTVYQPNNYFFKLNLKSQPQSIVIHPFSPNNVNFEATFVSSSSSDVCFVEVWSKREQRQTIVGCLQLNIKQGSLYQKMALETIRKQTIGWLQVFWCLDEGNKMRQVIEAFKNRTTQQQFKQNVIDNIHGSGPAIKKDVQPGQVPFQRKQKPKPISPDGQFSPVPNAGALESKLSHSNIYLKLLNNWRLSSNPQYKVISDRLSSLQTVSQLQLRNWLRLLVPDPEASKLLQIFPEAFRFNWLVNSYYIYFQYLSIYRTTLEHLLSHLTLGQSKLILIYLSEAVVYFGYIDLNTLINIFDRAGVGAELTEHILFFLANEDEDMVLKSVLVDVIKNKNISGLTPNGRIFAHLVRTTGLEEEDEWDMSKMSHLQYIVLKDNQPRQLPKLPEDNKLSEQAILSQHSNIPQPHVVEPQSEPKIQKPLIEVLVHSIQSQVADLTDVIINSKIYLSCKELPKKIRVFDEQQMNVRVHSRQGIILEGSSVISRGAENKKIGLFVKGKEMGELYLGEHDNQIILQIQKTRQIQERRESIRQLPKQYPLQSPVFTLSNVPLRLEILDITPMGHYQISIQSSTINFPQQYSTTIVTASPKLRLSVSNKEAATHCVINVVEGVQKYPLSREDGSVFCIVQLRILTNCLEQTKKTYKRRLFLILKDIHRFVNTSQTPLVYILIEYNNTFQRTSQFSFQSETQPINFSTQIEQSQIYSLKLFTRNNKLLGKFQFQIRLENGEGIYKKSGVLAEGEYRLELIVYEINLQRDLQIREDKVQNIMRLFVGTHARSIHKSLSNGRELKQILREDYHYTLSQINIIEKLLGDRQPLKLFNVDGERVENRVGHTIKEVYDQFSVYDFNNDGYVSREKAELVCSLLEIRDLDLQGLIPSIRKSIVDCNNKNKGEVDYYQLITLLFPDQYLFEDKRKQQIRRQQEHVKGYARVQLRGFQDLIYRQRPPNVCFQINGKFITDPVLRCSTYQFEEYPETIVELPTSVKIYNKEYGGDSLWSYKLVAQSPLTEIIEVMGGRVEFKITKLSESELKQIACLPQKRADEPVIQPIPRQQPKIQQHQLPSSIMHPVPDLQETRRQPRKEDLSNQELQQARRINYILQTSVDLSKYQFQSSDEEN